MKEHLPFRVLFCAALLLFAALPADAQHLQVIDTKFYCENGSDAFDEIHDIIQTKDKGFAFVCQTLDSGGGGGIIQHCAATYRHFMMGRLDSLGNVLWTKNMCDVGLGTTICETPDGGFVTNGGPVPTGNFGMLIYRYDKRGNLLWMKNYGKDALSGTAQIINTPDHGFLLMGYASYKDTDIPVIYRWPPVQFQPNDWILMKLDSMGNKQWVRTLGTSDDESEAHIVCDGKSYYLVGAAVSKDHDCADTHNYPGFTIYTIKLDSAGNVLWSKAHGAGYPQHLLWDERDNTIIAAGRSRGGFEFTGSLGADDFFLMKLDTAGNYKWGKIFGTADVEPDGVSFCKAPNKGYFMAGSTQANHQEFGDLVSIDSNGNQLEFRQINTNVDGIGFLGIFPWLNNTYAIFGVTAGMRLDEGTGQNCPYDNTRGSAALTLSKLQVWGLDVPQVAQQASDFSLSPNPAHHSFTLRFAGVHTSGKIYCTNSSGQVVFTQSLAAQQVSVAISSADWPHGSYVICWQPENALSGCSTITIR